MKIKSMQKTMEGLKSLTSFLILSNVGLSVAVALLSINQMGHPSCGRRPLP